MSLDVDLYISGVSSEGTGIYIRENGKTREISREEWDERFPNQELVIAQIESEYVYSDNITHNLNGMADKAGIYEHLWRPEEIAIDTAWQLIEPLEQGLLRLKLDPKYFKQFNPPNGWGSYEGLVQFVESYLQACKRYPMAKISVSR